MSLPQGVHLTIPPPKGGESILTSEALSFLVILHRTFEKRRAELLEHRKLVQVELDKVGSLRIIWAMQKQSRQTLIFVGCEC